METAVEYNFRFEVLASHTDYDLMKAPMLAPWRVAKEYLIYKKPEFLPEVFCNGDCLFLSEKLMQDFAYFDDFDHQLTKVRFIDKNGHGEFEMWKVHVRRIIKFKRAVEGYRNESWHYHMREREYIDCLLGSSSLRESLQKYPIWQSDHGGSLFYVNSEFRDFLLSLGCEICVDNEFVEVM